MNTKTFLQKFILLAIQGEPAGTTIRLPNLYQNVRNLLTREAPQDAPSNTAALWNELRRCAQGGDLPKEPRWKNDVRWAIRYAVQGKLLKHVGTPKSGEWLRI